MVDYKEIFKKFYDNSTKIKIEVNNYNMFLERGLALCILSKCLHTNDFQWGVELSKEKIFEILDIDTDKEGININLFKNYVALNLNSGIKILSLSNPNVPKMTQICSYDGTFVTNAEYVSFEPLEILANELDIPIYPIESNLLKSKFKDLVDLYIGENLNEIMLLGCVDKNNIVNSDFNITSEMKKIISASCKENISIYDYLKENYILNNLSKYIKKYPAIKDNKLSMHKLLSKYKKAELIPSSELLTDKMKNDFKVNIQKSIAQRKELEKFIFKGWQDKHLYDMLLEDNNETMNMADELENTLKPYPRHLILKMNESVIFDSREYRPIYKVSINTLSNPIKIGKYNFKKSYIAIEGFHSNFGPMGTLLKLVTSQDRKSFSIYSGETKIYPSVHN